ncbi:MAG TPA: two-component regulator propeller domain-containing protein, partial [Saprospiraceae bacterium]|nr:two-component regulator propeller domain-containing protein [Saprospiraceae bacterium]
KSIHLDSDNRLFIGTNKSQLLCRDLCSGDEQWVDIHSEQSKKSSALTTIRFIQPFGKDSLLLGSWMGGLHLVVLREGKWKTQCFENRNESDVRVNIVTGIALVNDSCWWVGRFGAGIGLYHPQHKTYYRTIQHESTDPNSLSDNYIHDLYRDAAGSVWVGTNDGINKYDPGSHRFSTIQIPAQKDETAIYRNPYSLVEDRTDSSQLRLLITVPGLGVLTFDRRFKKLLPIRIPNLQQELTPGDRFYEMKYNHRGELLVLGTSGFYQFDPRNGKIKKLKLPNELKLENVRKWMQDRNRNYWISSSTAGLYMLDSAFNKVVQYRYDPDGGQTIPDDVVFCILEDHRGMIWIGTQNRGLCMLDPVLNQFRYFSHDKSNPQSLPDNGVFDLYEDAGRNLWIATENGLARMDPERKKMKIFTTAEGLSNNNITSITPDERNRLWLCTNKGLSVLNMSNGSIQIYSQEDGLPSNRMDGAGLLTREGHLFFSTNSMISWCDPLSFVENRIPPRTWITSIKVYGKEIPLQRRDGKLPDIHVHYRENIFSADFASLNYTNSEKNQFAYMLENYDPGWNYVGRQSMANYSNLPGGRYVFKVRSSNNDGLWSETGDQVRVVVHPPFWNTWWFFGMAIGLIGLAFYSYYRIRIGQFLKVQKLRMDLARDLHDDVGSTLSSIHLSSSMGGRMADAGKDPAPLFQSIQQASREAMDMMSEIVWSISPEHDRLEQVSTRMRHHASEILESAGISLVFEEPEKGRQVQLPLRIRKELFLIFKEALNNLSKYSGAKVAVIRFDVNKSWLQLEIRDDGKGFDAREIRRGHGLKNMKSRAESIQGSFEMESWPGSGTRIFLRIPLLP